MKFVLGAKGIFSVDSKRHSYASQNTALHNIPTTARQQLHCISYNGYLQFIYWRDASSFCRGWGQTIANRESCSSWCFWGKLHYHAVDGPPCCGAFGEWVLIHYSGRNFTMKGATELAKFTSLKVVSNRIAAVEFSGWYPWGFSGSQCKDGSNDSHQFSLEIKLHRSYQVWQYVGPRRRSPPCSVGKRDPNPLSLDQFLSLVQWWTEWHWNFTYWEHPKQYLSCLFKS